MTDDGTKYKKVAKTVFYFLLAGLFEIGGVYLIWLWLREDFAFGMALAGTVSLFIYALIQTLQHQLFHRVYAAYAGFFIVLSMLWGWIIAGTTPDVFDVLGAAVAIAGAAMIFYWPRRSKA